MITRKLYTHSNVQVNGSGLLVQSFDLSRNLAHEQIEDYGNNNFYQVIGEPITSTCSVSCYIQSGDFGNLVSQWASHTASNDPQRETVQTDKGGLDHALMSSIKINAAIGSVPTASLDFVGAISTGTPLAESSSSQAIGDFNSTENVLLNGGDACAQKISFDWSIPVTAVPKYTESLSYPTGFFGEPVGVSTLSVEGVSAFLDHITSVDFAGFSIALSDVKVIASGINQAVGTVGATYNATYQCSSNNVTFS